MTKTATILGILIIHDVNSRGQNEHKSFCQQNIYIGLMGIVHMGNSNTRFVRKITKMTDEQLEAYVEKITSEIATASLPRVEAIFQQMEIINEIIEESIY